MALPAAPVMGAVEGVAAEVLARQAAAGRTGAADAAGTHAADTAGRAASANAAAQSATKAGREGGHGNDDRAAQHRGDAGIVEGALHDISPESGPQRTRRLQWGFGPPSG